MNLAEIASVCAGRAQPDSHDERCRRFLRDVELPYAEVAQFIVGLRGVSGGWTLAVDRTNWKLGKTALKLLGLAIGHQGTASPIGWFPRDKAGNSNTEERILLRELFLSLFAKEQGATLVADRDFGGKTWLEWWTAHDLPFQLRGKENLQLTSRGRQLARRERFRSATVAPPLRLKRPCQMWGGSYYLRGCRLPAGEFLLLVSPPYEPQARAHDAQRWGIETLFAALKTRGFKREDTHGTTEDRWQNLCALLALACAWCHQVGAWLHAQQPLQKKQPGRFPPRLFRRGLDCLRRLFTQATHRTLPRSQQVLALLPAS